MLLDWLVLEPLPPFLEGLKGLQSRERWEQVRETLFSMWLSGGVEQRIVQHVRRVMGSYGFEMWARAGREISASYQRFGSPLKALSWSLRPPFYTYSPYPRTMNISELRKKFVENHKWFRVHRLDVKTHFPSLEDPETVSAFIKDFIG